VAASVDRVGRNVRDTLNTQTLLTSQDRVVVTADHAGVWDFSDPNQENEWLAKAWGSQMELRAIQKRNRDETVRARKAGEPKAAPALRVPVRAACPDGEGRSRSARSGRRGDYPGGGAADPVR
jgi:DNA invertase Pin-like site-specific DNA recombinase